MTEGLSNSSSSPQLPLGFDAATGKFDREHGQQSNLGDLGSTDLGNDSHQVADHARLSHTDLAPIELDPGRRYPALQSSFSHRKSMQECPRQSFEWMRREKGRQPGADPADRNVLLKTSLTTSPEFLGKVVHEAISYALNEVCGKKLGEAQFSPSRTVTLDELLERANRTYVTVMGLSAGASRIHFASDPKRFPLFVEDVQEMNGKALVVEGQGQVAMHNWREELWRDIKTCITNFYTQFYAVMGQQISADGRIQPLIGGFSQLRPGRFPHGDFLSIEGWQDSEFSSDAVGAGSNGNSAWPHFKVPILHTIKDDKGNFQRHKYEGKNICIIDFAYAEPNRDSGNTPDQPGKVFIYDWKTNRLDPETHRPFGRKTSDHLQQLAEYAYFMLQLYPTLTPHDITLRVCYLRGEGISAEQRIEEYSAGSIDPSPNMAAVYGKIRREMEDRANRFFDPISGQTDVSLWPYTTRKSACNYCKIAADCDGAPEEAREAMNFSLLTAPRRDSRPIVDEGLSA